jgi:uncharacterized protein (TIGR01244 family)
VAPQLSLDDVDAAATAGYDVILCNRPDDEEPGQLNAGEVEPLVAKNGMRFVAIPIASGISPEQIAATRDLIETEAKVLAYCRSGRRSALLYALAAVTGGADPDAVLAQTRAAGYDLDAQGALLHQLAG